MGGFTVRTTKLSRAAEAAESAGTQVGRREFAASVAGVGSGMSESDSATAAAALGRRWALSAQIWKQAADRYAEGLTNSADTYAASDTSAGSGVAGAWGR